MRLAWIELLDFRSYPSLHWSPDPGVNLLIGPNAAGKTNLLEAIGYLAALRSVRGAGDDAMVGEGAERAFLRGEFASGEDLNTLVEIELPVRGSRRVQVGHQRLRRASDLHELVRIVTFLPEDLDVVKRGPGGRRDLIDEVTVQLRPSAALDQSDYDRALRQRNALLKAGKPDEVTLAVWDERLSHAGGKVMARRAATMQQLAEHLEDAYRAIADTPARFILEYRSDWGGEADPAIAATEHAAALADSIRRHRRADIERRVTTVGLHRDDLTVLLDGRDLRSHGSQGEQRTAALALRLASHRAIAVTVGRMPVLLLDDVFSELDEARGRRLAVALPPGQTVITSARPEDLPVRGRRWRVESGRVEELP